MAYKDPEDERAYQRVYRAANREKKSAGSRAWHAANRDEHNARKREYHAAHLEQAHATQAVWRAANREKIVHYGRWYWARVGYFKQLNRRVDARVEAFKQMPVPMVKP